MPVASGRKHHAPGQTNLTAAFLFIAVNGVTPVAGPADKRFYASLISRKPDLGALGALWDEG
jgi:hypothetical protein